MKITYRKCLSCGWIDSHAVKWCPNCGDILRILEADLEAYIQERLEWVKQNGPIWPISVNFDHETGKEYTK